MFNLSHEAAQMTVKQAAERISLMREEAWQKHVKKRNPDGTCRAGCPLHA